MRVVVINAGSSTLKAALIDVETTHTHVDSRASFELGPDTDLKSAFSALVDDLLRETSDPPDAIGHRVVHGGREFSSPTRIVPSIEQTIESLACWAPLHNPVALEGIRVARERFTNKPQIAVFDTAFHADRSVASLRYPLPWELCDSNKLYRYGFHGIAHASLLQSLIEAQGQPATAVTLQLGAGCSICAIEDGHSVETSMGFSPLGGLPMATRCGDLDPGVVLQLFREGYSVDELDEIFNRRSGIFGLCGASGMREALELEADGNERAATATAIFVRAVVGLIGAYLTLLRGRGALVFGGGIGTGSAEIRRRIADGLSAWNVELDPRFNDSDPRGRISSPDRRPVYVFETDEESLIAENVYDLLKSGVN